MKTREDLAPLSYEGKAHGVSFTCHPAPYAKGKMQIQLSKDAAISDGFKGAADRLLDALNATWRHRGGFALAPSRATLWRKLFVAGWDASTDWRGAWGISEPPQLHSPDGRAMTLKEAIAEVNKAATLIP